MFVVSLSGKKLVKTVAAAVSIIFVFLLVFSFFCGKNASENSAHGYPTAAATPEDVLDFIAFFGWQVDEEPLEIKEVIIPADFDEVYENYNEIQKNQGFNLSDFKGVRVSRWSYIVRNYPGTDERDDYIRINILVADGEIIGGDVCSIKLDGFMHGFYKEQVE